MALNYVSRFEKKGLKLVAAKFTKISEEIARQLYETHGDRPFFKGLVKYISSSTPSLVMILEAEGVIDIVRKMLGATFGYAAEPGTIRGDLSASRGYNLVHGADTPESAKREISLFFEADEILDYDFSDSNWLYGKNE